MDGGALKPTTLPGRDTREGRGSRSARGTIAGGQGNFYPGTGRAASVSFRRIVLAAALSSTLLGTPDGARTIVMLGEDWA